MTWLRNFLSVLGVAALSSLTASGCEENESMLFVKGVLALETTNCLAKSDSGGTLRAFGRVDTEIAKSYVAALLVGSQLTQRGSREQLRTETARLSLEGAEVTLNDDTGKPLPIGVNPFTTLGTGFIDAAGGTQPGFGSIFVNVIPASVMEHVSTALGGAGVIQAKIRVFGTTLGGQAIESGPYTYSIQVCKGCLISYPSLDVDSDGLLVCPPTPAASGSETICSPGQDQTVPCNLCLGRSEACKSPCKNCAFHRSAGECQSQSQPVPCP